MSNQPAQPDPADSPEETADLQAQVDVLLAQIEEHLPEAVPESHRRAKPTPQGAQQDTQQNTQQDVKKADAPAPEQAAPAAAHDPAAQVAQSAETVQPAQAAQTHDPPPHDPLPQEKQPPPADAPSAPAAEHVDPSVAEPAVAPAAPAGPEASIEQDMAASDALAQQIQDLLDEAQAEAEGLATEPGGATTGTGEEADMPAAPAAKADAGAAAGEQGADIKMSSEVMGASEATEWREPQLTPQGTADDGIGGASATTATAEPDVENVDAVEPAAVSAAGEDASTSSTPAEASASASQQHPEPASVTAASDDEQAMGDMPAGDFEVPEAVISEDAAEVQAETAAPTPSSAEMMETVEATAGADAGESVEGAESEINEDDESDPNLISRIDQMLADEADDVLSSGDFESVSDMLESDDDAPADEPAKAPADAAAAAAPAPAMAAAASEGATAADVARELDEQPEQRVASSEPPPSTAPVAASETSAPAVEDADDDDEMDAVARGSHRSRLAVLAGALRQTCGVINAPIYRFSPEVRSTIGWVGVMTLFNALCLMLVGLIR